MWIKVAGRLLGKVTLLRIIDTNTRLKTCGGAERRIQGIAGQLARVATWVGGVIAAQVPIHQSVGQLVIVEYLPQCTRVAEHTLERTLTTLKTNRFWPREQVPGVLDRILSVVRPGDQKRPQPDQGVRRSIGSRLLHPHSSALSAHRSKGHPCRSPLPRPRAPRQRSRTRCLQGHSRPSTGSRCRSSRRIRRPRKSCPYSPGTHVQVPPTQVSGGAQVPQLPPQPSSPQFASVQSGAHKTTPLSAGATELLRGLDLQQAATSELIGNQNITDRRLRALHPCSKRSRSQSGPCPD